MRKGDPVSVYPRDVLLKALWKDENLAEMQIIIVSRGMPDDIAILSGEDIVHIGRSYLNMDNDTSIPFHRIKCILLGDEVIWSRGSFQKGDIQIEHHHML